MVEVGHEAPEFTLKDQSGQDVSLADFRGKKNVVVVFYPFTFTGGCQGELCALRDDPSMFESADAQVLAISCDTRHAHAQWAEAQGFTFPVLSDFWPHGVVARRRGVQRPARLCEPRDVRDRPRRHRRGALRCPPTSPRLGRSPSTKKRSRRSCERTERLMERRRTERMPMKISDLLGEGWESEERWAAPTEPSASGSTADPPATPSPGPATELVEPLEPVPAPGPLAHPT